MQERVQAAADFFVKHGAKISDRARPAIDNQAAFKIFGGLLMAGISGRKHDEVFWKRSAIYANVSGNEAEGEGQLVDRIFTHGEWIELDSSPAVVAAGMAGLLSGLGRAVVPAAPTVAVPHDPKHAWHERKIIVKGRPTSPVNPVSGAPLRGGLSAGNRGAGRALRNRAFRSVCRSSGPNMAI